MKKKIVFNNITFTFQKAGGVSMIWSEILRYFLEFGVYDWEIWLVVSKEDEKNIYWQQLKQDFDFEKLGIHIISENRKLWLRRLWPIKLSEFTSQFIYFTSGNDWSINRYAKNVSIFHDALYEIYFKWNLPSIINVVFRYFTLKNSNLVFCVSKNSAEDLKKYYPTLITENRKIEVVYNGLPAAFGQVQLSVNNADTYGKDVPQDINQSDSHLKKILFVGRRWGYKNLKYIYNEEYLGDICEIYFVGGEEFTSEEIKQLNRIFSENGWHKLKTLTEDELLEIYKSAYCLFYPSKAEGFGLPVIEAQALGCPVVCYPNAAVKEIAQDSVLYLNTEVSNFRKIIEGSELNENRNLWIQRGFENARNYPASRMASQYYSKLKELI